MTHSGKFATIRESNHGSGACKELYAQYYVPKSSISLARTSVLYHVGSALLKSIILVIRKV